jgi:hypothetical protein
VSDGNGTYEEANPTALNPTAVVAGADLEYDFPLRNNAATRSSRYCFRLIRSGGAPLDGYTNYPSIVTQPYEQEMDDLLRHGAFFTEQNTEQPYYWADIY